MVVAFYTAAVVALLATLRVVTNSNPVHALLYLVISLISVAMIFFCVGAPFAAALEMVVYAGAIMVLFVFAVMMLNLGDDIIAQEKAWLKPSIWIGPSLLASVLLLQVFQSLIGGDLSVAGVDTIDAKRVGIALYGPYLLAVELASILLLAALVAAYHLGRTDENQ